MYLDNYTVGEYTPGAAYWKLLLWYFVGDPLVRSYLLPFSALKVFILKSFGAQIGQGVRLKSGIRIKFPWRLSIGNYVWIGENAWLDNLAQITLEDHVCLSQGVYLCTGNHDWSDRNFKLLTSGIYIETGSWIAAHAVIGPGVKVGHGAILGMGSVTGRSLEPMTIYAGNPSQPIRKREIRKR
jgi:putative colanic acid biosynthesis acetyltransferase WcaF